MARATCGGAIGEDLMSRMSERKPTAPGKLGNDVHDGRGTAGASVLRRPSRQPRPGRTSWTAVTDGQGVASKLKIFPQRTGIRGGLGHIHSQPQVQGLKGWDRQPNPGIPETRRPNVPHPGPRQVLRSLRAVRGALRRHSFIEMRDPCHSPEDFCLHDAAGDWLLLRQARGGL